MRRPRGWRVPVFVLVVLGCLALAGVSVGRAVKRAHSSHPPKGVKVVEGASLTGGRKIQVEQTASLSAASGPQILFRNAIPDKTFNKVAVAPLSNPNKTRAVSDLTCDRVYYAGGHGLCLTATSGFSRSYVAKIFDANFKVVHQYKLTGIPSRARVSPDGRYGVSTVFVNGDSYAPGNFSTRTIVVNMLSGKEIANLEQFKVTRDGKPFHNRNFNFWGVTFAPGDDRFYATLGSGLHTYLVQGSLRARRMVVIHPHVECPSLSPDGTRIAYKRSLGSHGTWRLYVLNLNTMKETALAETNSVDDQAEWLDNDHVLYWRGADIWSVPADGSGAPHRLVTEASSPAVIRNS
jgi:hypothetical protein